MPLVLPSAEADSKDAAVQSPVQMAQTPLSVCRGAFQFLLQHAVFLAREELMPSVGLCQLGWMELRSSRDPDLEL